MTVREQFSTVMSTIDRLEKTKQLERIISRFVGWKHSLPRQSMSLEISEREKQLEAILQTAVDAIITIDEHGIIQSANPATERLFGYAIAELLGKNVKQLMPSPYFEEHDQYLANYMRTDDAKIIGIGREVVAKRKDGSTFPIDLAISEARVGEQRIFTGIVRDASDRKWAEELEAGLGRILETSLNEVFIFDAETLRFLVVNNGARENIGYTMDELREMTPVDIKPEHTEETLAELVKPLVSGEQELLVFETVHCRKDGTHYVSEVHLQLTTYQGRLAYAAIILDITDRKKSEESLRVQERALESAVNGILITDVSQPDNPIIYVNSAMEQITGYSRDEVLGRNCRFLQRDDREQEALNEVRAAIKEERECKVELRNYRKDGTPFWNGLTISPVQDSSGKTTHFVGIQSDITERKNAEAQLARMNDELEQRVQERTHQLEAAQERLVRKERLATLGQLAGGVAHEIRNPMGVIRNAVYFLQQIQGSEDEDTKDALGEISRGLANSERIVSELLDYARGPSTEPSLFLLDEALTSALDMVKVPSSVILERPEPFDIRVHADRGQIERLLANLIQNATQAMPDGGTLTLRCDSAGDSVVTEVSDTGVGIADDELEKVFEPLFTKRAKGIGLGLPLCRRYAELNGGSLDVESTLGKGSTFRVALRLKSSNGA